MALATSFAQGVYAAPYITQPTASYTFTFDNEGSVGDVVFMGGANLTQLFAQLFNNTTGASTITTSVTVTDGSEEPTSGTWLGTLGSPVSGNTFGLALQDFAASPTQPGVLLAVAGTTTTSLLIWTIQYTGLVLGTTGPLAVGFTALGGVLVTGSKVFLVAPGLTDLNFGTAGMTLTTTGLLGGPNLAGMAVAVAATTWAGSLFLQGTLAAAQVVSRQYLVVTDSTAEWVAANNGSPATTTLNVGVPMGTVVPLSNTSAFLRPSTLTDVLRWVNMPAGSAWTVNTVSGITAGDVPLAAYVVTLATYPLLVLWWTGPASLRAIAGTPTSPNTFGNSPSTTVTLTFAPVFNALVTTTGDTAVFVVADELGNLAVVRASVNNSIGGGGLALGITVAPQTAVGLPVGSAGTALGVYYNTFATPPRPWYSYTAMDAGDATTVYVGPLVF
jgi:hypothetical protein